MSNPDSRTLTDRRARFEQVEERIVLSADPLTTFVLDPTEQIQLQAQYEEVTTMALPTAQSQINYVRSQYGLNGTGQTVAVIDTGIAWDHYALGGGYGSNYRVVGGWDFAENDSNPFDDGPAGFHGTHVAGIIGSSDSKYQGVASGVDLVALRVFNDQGGGNFTWVEQALRWVHQNRNSFENPITTINLSLGTNWNANTVPDWAMLEDEFAQLEADGIFISVAAGNSFQSYKTPGLSYPAASQYVVPVASHDANGNMSSFSQRNSRVIAAPGENIVSTVPDHVYGESGPSDRFAGASGTSMAAPFLAGASVLVREAMQFLGYQNINQDKIYDHFRATADSVFDSVTNANYSRLNLQRALDSLMADEFGDTANSAYSLGTLSDGSTFSGNITKLTDVDALSFTAGSTGKMTLEFAQFKNLNLQLNINGQSVAITNGKATFDVVGGQSYTMLLSSPSGVGHYEVDVSLSQQSAPAPPAAELGLVTQTALQNQTISGEQTFRFRAGMTGTMTIEGVTNGAPLSFQVFNSQNTLIASNTNGARIDFAAVAGGEYSLRVVGNSTDFDLKLTNLLNLDKGRLTIGGTDGADAYTISTTNGYQVNLNGTTYSFTSRALSSIVVSGGSGTDSLAFTGNASRDTVTLRVGSMTYSSTSYAATASSFENVTVNTGGGGDRVDLYDSAGDDSVVSGFGSASMTGTGFNHSVVGSYSVRFFASTGNDTARMIDSAQDDNFVARGDTATMSNRNYSNSAFGFDRYEAVATNGGIDYSYFYDSAGNDTFVANSAGATLTTPNRVVTAAGFDRYYMYATLGGFDTATLRDSAADDTFVGRSSDASLSNASSYIYASGFDQVTAISENGGFDRAYLYDSRGNDVYSASGNQASMTGTGFLNSVQGWEQVHASAVFGGYDRAYFVDTAGDDNYYSSPFTAYMTGAGYANFAYSFEEAHGYSVSGGTDSAMLYGSFGKDTLSTNGSTTAISGKGFSNSITGFSSANVDGRGGGDLAFFTELGASDVVSGTKKSFQASYADRSIAIANFSSITATAKAGEIATSDVAAVDFVFKLVGQWQSSLAKK